MKIITCLLAFCQAFYASAQSLPEPLNSRPARLSATAPSFASAFSFEANPAALSGPHYFSVAACGERRFLLSELNSYALAALVPLQGNAFGVHIGHGGGGGWSRSSVALAYGHSLGKLLSAGARFRYNTASGGVSKLSEWSADAGVVFQLGPGLHAGLAGSGIVQSSTEKEIPLRSGQYTFSFSWESPAQWLLAMELTGGDGRRPALLAGCTYVFSKMLRVQAALDTGLSIAHFGLSIPIAGLQLQPSVAWHRELGPTPGLSISYAIN